MLNPTRGNMYQWITHTWNPIKGKCSHVCVYCFMKIFPQKPIRLVEKELQENLGEGNIIFVGSSTDMFAEDVPENWIRKVLAKCRESDKNIYLFQTKNPSRFKLFDREYPSKTVFGTTLETNRDMSSISKAPSPQERVEWMSENWMEKKMVTLEPIIDFDLEPFVAMIKRIKPEWVNIGADSKNHHLPEPSREKVEQLIVELKKFTEVRKKSNLERLMSVNKNV